MAETLTCLRCGQPHSGTIMRTDSRFSRVRDLIFDPNEVPRTDDGRLAFCHHCQRSVYFAGGTIRLLADDLRRAAMTRIKHENNHRR